MSNDPFEDSRNVDAELETRFLAQHEDPAHEADLTRKYQDVPELDLADLR